MLRFGFKIVSSSLLNRWNFCHFKIYRHISYLPKDVDFTTEPFFNRTCDLFVTEIRLRQQFDFKMGSRGAKSFEQFATSSTLTTLFYIKG